MKLYHCELYLYVRVVSLFLPVDGMENEPNSGMWLSENTYLTVYVYNEKKDFSSQVV